jgi:hypothetical protein
MVGWQDFRHMFSVQCLKTQENDPHFPTPKQWVRISSSQGANSRRHEAYEFESKLGKDH